MQIIYLRLHVKILTFFIPCDVHVHVFRTDFVRHLSLAYFWC